MKSIATQLIAWFHREQRDFSWRLNDNPYWVWVLEVMSQQTILSVVTPKFEQFMLRLPTLSHLAQADESTLRELWKGLGYYARIRNLQKGANYILENYGSEYPKTEQDWLNVPGVGPYTAAMICSRCFHIPIPALDGNAARVTSRLLLLKDETHQTKGKRKSIQYLTEQILETNNPGDFNQGMIELGATVCTPKKPRCSRCPITSACLAFQSGLADSQPPAKPKKPPLQVTLEPIIYLSSDFSKVVLFNRKQGFLKQTKGFLLSEKDFPAERNQWEEPELLRQPATFLHTITHHHITVKPKIRVLSEKTYPKLEWMDWNQAEQELSTGLDLKIMKAVKSLGFLSLSPLS